MEVGQVRQRRLSDDIVAQLETMILEGTLRAGERLPAERALAEQFGTAAEFGDPAGGIYLWIKLPEQVDTVKLAQAALKASAEFSFNRIVIDGDMSTNDTVLLLANGASGIVTTRDPAAINHGFASIARFFPEGKALIDAFQK